MPAAHPDEKRKETSAIVFNAMYQGNSLRKACIIAGIAPTTLLGWCDSDKNMSEQYARAREACIDKIADEIIEIADEAVGTTVSGSTDAGAVAKQRLQVDTRKWLLSKLAPKRFGDRIENVVSGPDGGAVVINAVINGVPVKRGD